MVLTLSKDGNPEIYEVNTITKKSRRLTNDPNVDCSPVYSPDGSRIAFTSGRSSRPHIYVMSADGTNQKALTQGRYEDSAAWHPAGDWIAFAQKQPTTEDFDVCVIRPNGTGYKVLTQGNRHNESPEFSPDGRHIVFASNRDGQSQLYSMNLETGKTRRLTWQTGECFSPAWSPV
jgi:TolB protein